MYAFLFVLSCGITQCQQFFGHVAMKLNTNLGSLKSCSMALHGGHGVETTYPQFQSIPLHYSANLLTEECLVTRHSEQVGSVMHCDKTLLSEQVGSVMHCDKTLLSEQVGSVMHCDKTQ